MMLRSGITLAVAVAGLIAPTLALGEDIDAVKRRLNRAVKRNEISFEQAAIMMNALRESIHNSHRHDDHAHHDDKRLDQFHMMERRIHEQVERGFLTPDQAHQKIEALHRELERDLPHRHANEAFAQAREQREVAERLRMAEAEIHELVENGQLGADEAEQKIKALHRHVQEQREAQAQARSWIADELRELDEDLEQAVAKGEITGEQAAEKYEFMKRKLTEEAHRRAERQERERLERERLERERDEREREERERDRNHRKRAADPDERGDE